MEDLADALHEVAVVLEMLRQSDGIRHGVAEVRHQIPHLGGVGPGAGKQARTRWRADGLLAVGAQERHSLFRNTVDVRRQDGLGAIAAEFRAQIVDGDEENVRPLGLGESG